MYNTILSAHLNGSLALPDYVTLLLATAHQGIDFRYGNVIQLELSSYT